MLALFLELLLRFRERLSELVELAHAVAAEFVLRLVAPAGLLRKGGGRFEFALQGLVLLELLPHQSTLLVEVLVRRVLRGLPSSLRLLLVTHGCLLPFISARPHFGSRLHRGVDHLLVLEGNSSLLAAAAAYLVFTR